MEIRRTRDSDLDEIADLRQTTIRRVNAQDYPDHVIFSWATSVNAEDFRESASRCERWVALEEQTIVGFCEHTPGCEISRIYVHTDHLRQGVGSRLLTVAEDALKERGCHHIRIESTTTARNFYENHGYTVNERTSYGGDAHAPVYAMSKRIAE